MWARCSGSCGHRRGSPPSGVGGGTPDAEEAQPRGVSEPRRPRERSTQTAIGPSTLGTMCNVACARADQPTARAAPRTRDRARRARALGQGGCSRVRLAGRSPASGSSRPGPPGPPAAAPSTRRETRARRSPPASPRRPRAPPRTRTARRSWRPPGRPGTRHRARCRATCGRRRHAREQIAPALVGPQGMRPGRRIERLAQVELHRIERQRASAERRDDDEDEDRSPQGPHQPSRIRGSTTVYSTSTARLTSAKLTANTRSAPWISA